MGTTQIVIIALVILVLFGGGKLSGMLGDLGKGVKSFKQGLNEEDDKDSAAAPRARIEGPHQEAPHHQAKPAGGTVEGSNSAEPVDRTP